MPRAPVTGRVLMPASLIPLKDPLTLVQAAAQIRIECRISACISQGSLADAPYVAEVRREIARLGLEQTVTLLGALDARHCGGNIGGHRRTAQPPGGRADGGDRGDGGRHSCRGSAGRRSAVPGRGWRDGAADAVWRSGALADALAELLNEPNTAAAWALPAAPSPEPASTRRVWPGNIWRCIARLKTTMNGTNDERPMMQERRRVHPSSVFRPPSSVILCPFWLSPTCIRRRMRRWRASSLRSKSNRFPRLDAGCARGGRCARVERVPGGVWAGAPGSGRTAPRPDSRALRVFGYHDVWHSIRPAHPADPSRHRGAGRLDRAAVSLDEQARQPAPSSRQDGCGRRWAARMPRLCRARSGHRAFQPDAA